MLIDGIPDQNNAYKRFIDMFIHTITHRRIEMVLIHSLKHLKLKFLKKKIQHQPETTVTN